MMQTKQTNSHFYIYLVIMESEAEQIWLALREKVDIF